MIDLQKAQIQLPPAGSTAVIGLLFDQLALPTLLLLCSICIL
jgi:hypothetical protein